MKNKKIILVSILIIIIIIILLNMILNKTNVLNVIVDNSIVMIDMVDDNNLNLETDSQIKLNVKIEDIFKTSNKIAKWESSNEDVASVNKEGVVKTKKSGTTNITCKLKNKTIKTKLTVYDIKNIVIIVGDSRMDQFKDDNNFKSTSKYEIKYTTNHSLLSNFEKLYVVSLSGMQYDWLAGLGEYKKNNATNYVKEIIEEYENKTSNTKKYKIKILFNLGINDLNHKYLKDDTPSDIASKYLTKLEENMNGKWQSNIIKNISLSIITLFPVNDKQVECYFPIRYNKDVIEFNNYIKNNYKNTICDAYNDINFTDDVFRERHGNDSCATRDGLHFDKDFNKTVLYSYLVNVCANK